MLRVVEAGKGVTQHLLQTEVLCRNPQALAVFQVLCTLHLGELVPHFINTVDAVEAWEGGKNTSEFLLHAQLPGTFVALLEALPMGSVLLYPFTVEETEAQRGVICL